MPSSLRIKKTPITYGRLAERRHAHLVGLARAAFRREQSELERQSPAQGMARDPYGGIGPESGRSKIVQ